MQKLNINLLLSAIKNDLLSNNGSSKVYTITQYNDVLKSLKQFVRILKGQHEKANLYLVYSNSQQKAVIDFNMRIIGIQKILNIKLINIETALKLKLPAICIILDDSITERKLHQICYNTNSFVFCSVNNKTDSFNYYPLKINIGLSKHISFLLTLIKIVLT